jgi:TonB family protein
VDEEKVAVTPYMPPSRRRIMTGPDGRELHPRQGEEGPELAAKSPRKESPLEAEDDLGTILPEDFFPNVRIGEKTYLNVLRYPKISYFVRLKKIFKLTWNPQPVLVDYFFANQISAGQIETTVAFEIDRQGNLSKLFVYKSSGLPGYDDEAVRVISDSTPFAAPPNELLNDVGVLPLLFTFTVYL